MATSKLTVTVPDDLLQAARAAADGNLSAFVARAIRDQLIRDAMTMYAEDSARVGDDLDDLYSAAEDDLCGN
ncbi:MULTISPECIES: type II toxin-antitoxin system CcdA family antitoxin [unclassified Streptomyces]|uniref:type II toxin-antitoxin system CcdA family antitoxin n=1 Tax=unclassified Streptomyces TaxID=2593676 RepID=UPI002252E2AC|nr:MULTISPECIES: type II toxin-antitoxin system CcdA family antitoxin [unclassified Streptomyces]MCX5332351.1 type II toxin-antitoxin system CcdA family antitoxin [Streptomyces sp. NBC_00140]MCX5361730.1 type II toxin-antitoxin system CcdA family antitoxin [Streptomyces sp. NBC_00124]